MLQDYRFTALVTLAGLAAFFATGLFVGAGRHRFNIVAPATTGHPEFERRFRVQMNTLEWLVIFVPALWLFALAWSNDRLAAAVGAVWVLGRLIYMVTYYREATSRGPGFLIQLAAAAILWFGAVAGVVRTFL